MFELENKSEMLRKKIFFCCEYNVIALDKSACQIIQYKCTINEQKCKQVLQQKCACNSVSLFLYIIFLR